MVPSALPDLRPRLPDVPDPSPRALPLAARPLTEPHPDRLPPEHPHRDAVLAVHAEALARAESGYLDPSTGLFVLTAAFLADRGTCCGRGCRHCPYLDD